MVLIYMTTGDCVEVEAGSSARRVDDSVICYGEDGCEVASFPASDVEAFTRNEKMADLMRDEVCDEVTVIPEEDSSTSTI